MVYNLQLQEIAAATTYGTINQSLRSLDLNEFEQQAVIAGAADTLASQLQRLAKVYTATKPLLTAFSALPLMPQPWRAAVVLLLATIDAIVSSPGIDPDFKAGKDL